MKYLFICLLAFATCTTMAQNTPVFDQKQMIDVAQISTWNFSDRPAGWYRIAKTTFNNGNNALRANATFELRENADHSTLRFEVGVSYNNAEGSALTITSHSFFGSATFPKLRLITTSGIYEDSFLEVYVSPHNNNNQLFKAFLINPMADGDWQLVNWETGNVPSGYSATEFNADKLLGVGNINLPNILSVNRNGYVGLGVNAPQANLDVAQDIYGRTRILSDTFGAYNGNGLTITTNTAGNVPMIFKTMGADRLTITGTGNVGIGTGSPGEKLTVNGIVKANEIRVNGQGAPDYVFEESYKVETLEALESYIKANKHLPEVPSAKEFERDGIAVGEMNKLLLKKIEELTLYLIDLKKENTGLKQRLEKLETKVVSH